MSEPTSPLKGRYQCRRCGLYLSPFLHHTDAECKLVRALYPMLNPPKPAVPKAFYDAFSDEELQP